MSEAYANAEGKVMEWQPIETAPKDGTSVLLFGEWMGQSMTGERDGPCIDIGRFEPGKYERERALAEDGWWVLDTGDYYKCHMRPTHWMPLPDIPKD